MKEIQLSQGYVALVSDKDYRRVSQFKWSAMRAREPDSTTTQCKGRKE